jgi:hypothetical protein
MGFLNPDQTTGFSDDNNGVTFYNPETGKNEVRATGNMTGRERRELIDELGLGYYDTPDNGIQYGMRPEGARYNESGEFLTADPTKWMQGGVDYGGLSLGGAPSDAQPYNPNGDLTSGGGGGGGGFLPDFPGDRPDLPVPDGGPVVPWTGAGGQADTSWDWDAFAPKREGDGAWGGYDEDYQAFERYQPGMDSPWGMPNIEGGNTDFYQQQFVNQLRDEQGYQSRERAAQGRRQDALENPYEAGPMDWSKVNNGKGLGQVDISTGTPEDNRSWGLAEGFTEGMTQNEILSQAANWDGWGENERDLFNAFSNPDSYDTGLDHDFFNEESWWTKVGGDPTRIQESIRASDYDGANKEWLSSIADRLWQKQGKLGPAAPAGYAQPLASYAPTEGAT